MDRSNKKKAMRSMEKVKKKLETEKLSVTIFAEGTRNPADSLLAFKKGAFPSGRANRASYNTDGGRALY